jgi:hypothetical protein
MLSIKPSQFSADAFLKLGVACNLAIWLPFGLILGVAFFFGVSVVTFNKENVYGVGGLVTALIVSLVFAGVGTLFLLIGGLILRWFKRWEPTIVLAAPDAPTPQNEPK